MYSKNILVHAVHFFLLYYTHFSIRSLAHSHTHTNTQVYFMIHWTPNVSTETRTLTTNKYLQNTMKSAVSIAHVRLRKDKKYQSNINTLLEITLAFILMEWAIHWAMYPYVSLRKGTGPAGGGACHLVKVLCPSVGLVF